MGKATNVAKSTAKNAVSTSVQIVLDQLTRLGLNKTDFARKMGVSQDYVYRILNGRTPFPRARETLERIAEICAIDAYALAEYRQRDEILSVSTRLVWERMRERGLSREDLYQAMGGRISRPYFNSILRGDQPFPSNRAYIQMFALALVLPPTVFREFGPKVPPRWTPEDVEDLEERSYQLFFDKMMADYGFAQHELAFQFLDVSKVHHFFLPQAELPTELVEVLTRMGQLGMGFRELCKICGIPRERLSLMFSVAPAGGEYGSDVEAVNRCLRMQQD
jgi:hypothetical protein